MKKRISENTIHALWDFVGQNWSTFKTFCQQYGYDPEEINDELDKSLKD